jgi:F-type H+-transporting ATPase subunit b
MRIDWWTLGLQAANLLVLIWILSRFLFRPLTAMIEERRAAATRLLDEARTARDAAVAERDKAAQEAANLALTRSEAMKKAAEEAEAEKQAILAAARAEADRLRAAAEADIARAREDAAEAQADRASRLAVDIAAKLFSRLPDDARIIGFVDGLVEGLSGLPETTRSGMGTNGLPIKLTAARALTAAETRTCRERLSQALGRPVEINVQVDPALIAGLEIDMPHAAVRNSFRADLERIEAALTHAGQPTP